MIQSAKDFKLSNTNASLPNMSNTISSWFLNITLHVVKRVLNGADWVETTQQVINTKGVVQPPRDEDLKLLPEGTWSWQWMMLHCLPDVQLDTNQFIKYDGVTYKIMAKKDWRKYGYVRYTILEAFQASKIS